MTTAPHDRAPKLWPLVVALLAVVVLAGVFFATEASTDAPAAPPLGPTACVTTIDPPTGGTASQVTEDGVVYNVYTFAGAGALTPTVSVAYEYENLDDAATVGEFAGTAQATAGVEIAADKVRIRWPRFCQNISQPTGPSLAGSTFSWSPPAFIPTGQSVASYTVIYKVATDDSLGRVYASSTDSTALSIDLSGTTTTACAAANPSGWNCSGGIDLADGVAYEFQVFGRSSTGTGVGQLTPGFALFVP